MSGATSTWAICEPDGLIRWIVMGTKETAYQHIRGNQLFLESDQPLNVTGDFYNTKAGEFQPKVEFPALSVDVTPITGGYRITVGQIPVGTGVGWPDGEVTREEDGVLEADVTTPGTYLFAFEHPRYYDYEETVDVQA